MVCYGSLLGERKVRNMNYVLRGNKLYADKGKRPLTLKGKCWTQDTFSDVNFARAALISSGRGKPGDKLYSETETGIAVSYLDTEHYWRGREKEPVAVIQPTFEVEWFDDLDPDVSWIQEWIEASIEEGWLRCDKCEAMFKADDDRAEYDDCPACEDHEGRLEPVVALRIGHKGEPQPKDNPESYVAKREPYSTRKNAETAARESWGNRIDHEACKVTATWSGLTGHANLYGVSFDPREPDNGYRSEVEGELKQEALDNLMERLEKRADFQLP